MRSVAIAELTPGAQAPRGVYSRFGSLLLPPGAVLSEAVVTRLRTGKHETVLVPGEPDEPMFILPAPAAAPAVTIAAPQPAAAHSPAPPTAPAAVPAGATVANAHTPPTSEPVTESAREVRVPEPASPRDDTRRRQAAAGLRRRGADLLSAWSPVLERLPRRLTTTGPAPVVRASRYAPLWLDSEVAEMRRERVGVLERIFDRVALGRRTHAGALIDLVDELADLATRRPDRFAALAALGSPRPDNLADHAFTTGVLSVGIATRRSWSGADVRAVGAAALLADSGMLLLTPDIRSAPRPLSDEQRARLRDHPAHALALIDLVDTLPPAAAAIVLAHHEREDGSGYPRGLRGPAIHDGARALAVADTLAALTAPRAHRRRIDPFDAMVALINLASTGVLERASVGAVLRCTGLFPIGSTVLLSTGQAARSVALPDPSRPDRPLVRLLDEPGSGSLVDLSEPASARLRIGRAGAAAALLTRP
jgi:HD-GYP domain-containing protein (c-di-GMP phosphodiesterase class II)